MGAAPQIVRETPISIQRPCSNINIDLLAISHWRSHCRSI